MLHELWLFWKLQKENLTTGFYERERGIVAVKVVTPSPDKIPIF
jgi:hypothetical protein